RAESGHWRSACERGPARRQQYHRGGSLDAATRGRPDRGQAAARGLAGRGRRLAGCGWMAGQRLDLKPLAAFLNEIELVRVHVGEGLLQAAGPLYLDSFSAGGLAQAEIGAQVALGQIAAAAFDFPDLRNAAGHNPYSRSHRVPIAPGSHQPEIQKVISVA